MRVTSNTFPNSLNEQLGKLNLRQTRLNQQAATGQRIQNPEDDPSAIHRVMDLQHDVKELGQYQRNISLMQERSSVTYSTINSMKKLVDRAQELSTRAGGLRSQDELNIYSEEVNQLIKSGVQLMNARYRGDYVFAGTKSDQAPFVLATDSSGKVTSVTYQGNTETASSEIGAGVTMSAGVLGANTSGSGPRGLVSDSRTGADFFNHLIELRDKLISGDVPGIASSTNPKLAADEENFLIHVGINGAVQSQLETAAKLAKQDQLSFEKAISTESDADLSTTIVQLTQTQTAYQAALQSGGRILSQTLLDYLR